MKIVAMFGVLLAVVTGQIQAQEKTAEKEIEVFLQNVSSDNYDGLVKMFAVSNYLNAYTFRDRTLHNGLAELWHGSLPETNKIFIGISLQTRLFTLISELRRFQLAMIDRDAFEYGSVGVRNEVEFSEVEKKLTSEGQGPIQVIAIRQPADESAMIRINELWKKQAAYFHCDQLVEKVVLIKRGEKTYLTSFQMMRYGEGFFISQMSSAMAEISPGDVFEFSAEDFDSRYPQ